MPRPRQRVCLQDGLKLDLNGLIRRGSVRPGTRSGPYLIQWTNNYTGEVVRSGEITSGFCSQEEGWFRFEADGLDQRIILVARPRHFGGAQWYFICPVMNRRASVLWMPPGAERFCRRQTWGGRVSERPAARSVTRPPVAWWLPPGAVSRLDAEAAHCAPER
jgi:hypothetical protein